MFGKQNFRLDYEGTPTLSLTTSSQFTFKVPRLADLLADTYLCVTLPNIWSPIQPPQENNEWVPYEFQWIEHIGTQIIQQIQITCGNQLLQQYSGQYLYALMQRDFTTEKKILFDEMTGHVPEVYDPANVAPRVNAYPNAWYTDSPAGAQPSIAGRILYIPLGAWFTMIPSQAFPLVSLQYNELHITVTFRPINQWFTIRDVHDTANNYPIVAPNFNQLYMQMYRFLQTPPDMVLGPTSYVDTRTLWNADIHLQSTYLFLGNEERTKFATNDQLYVIPQVMERWYYNVTGQNKIDLISQGLVTGWMFYFQRSDVNLRNQWSNYTNWPYQTMPQDVVLAPADSAGSNPDATLTGLYITGIYNPQNTPTILNSLGILLDGEYRENMLPVGVYNFVEKYTRTGGNACNGLYCYSFCLHTDQTKCIQPSGSMNMNRFSSIQFEFTTQMPPMNPYAQTMSICDPATGKVVGTNKAAWDIYAYNYNLFVIEERLNLVCVTGGNCGLVWQS